MKIKVKSLQGDEFDLEVQVDQLVSSLKASISESPNGPPVERQKLVYKGRTMLDTHTLSEYNVEEGCKLHLIIQKTQSNPADHSQNASYPNEQSSNATASMPQTENQPTNERTSASNENESQLDRFEIILRERLAKHFTPKTVEKILINLQKEIDADLNSSSLDDLERLAKEKLNISND